MSVGEKGTTRLPECKSSTIRGGTTAASAGSLTAYVPFSARYLGISKPSLVPGRYITAVP